MYTICPFCRRAICRRSVEFRRRIGVLLYVFVSTGCRCVCVCVERCVGVGVCVCACVLERPTVRCRQVACRICSRSRGGVREDNRHSSRSGHRLARLECGYCPDSRCHQCPSVSGHVLARRAEAARIRLPRRPVGCSESSLFTSVLVEIVLHVFQIGRWWSVGICEARGNLVRGVRVARHSQVRSSFKLLFSMFQEIQNCQV